VGEAVEPEYELYDYVTDPMESRNLAGEQRAELEQMQQILAKYPQPIKP